MTDEQLMIDYQRDGGLRDVVQARHTERIRRYVSRHFKSQPALIDAAVSDVFDRIHDQRASFQPDPERPAAMSWLYGHAMAVSFDLLRIIRRNKAG